MPVSMGTHPRYLEELRLGGGYGSSPDGGADFDSAGNIQTNGDLDIDGDSAIGGNLDVGGDLSVAGLDTTWRTYLPANLGVPDPSLPCGPVTVTNWRTFHVVTPTLSFDPSTPQAAFFQFRLPKGYDGRPLTFTLEWGATTGTAGDVRWGINPISFVDGGTMISTGVYTYVVDSFLSDSTLHTCTMLTVPSSATANALTTIRVLRLSNHELDTFDTNSLLIGAEVSL